MAAKHDSTTNCHTYLVTTAYAGTASTDFATNLSRWLRDGSQPGAHTQDATQRFQQLLKNSA